MLIIEGTYENGQIVLNEQPKTLTKAKVAVHFKEEAAENKGTVKISPLGILKGAFTISDDFDEPLDDLKEYM